MSATNLTKNLKLSQFVASDKPSWLGDVNGDNKKIDDGYGVLAGEISKANDTASSAKSQSDANTQTLTNVNSELEDYGNRITALEAGGGTEQLEQRVNTLSTDVESLQTRADTFEEDITQNGRDITNLKNKVANIEPKVKTNTDNITSLQSTTNSLTTTIEQTSNTANSANTEAKKAKQTASQALTLAGTANNTANANASSISTINSKLSNMNVLQIVHKNNSRETYTPAYANDLLAIKTGDSSFILNFSVFCNTNRDLNSTGVLVGEYTFNEYAGQNAIMNDIVVHEAANMTYQIKGSFSNGTLKLYLASSGNYQIQTGHTYSVNTTLTFY